MKLDVMCPNCEAWFKEDIPKKGKTIICEYCENSFFMAEIPLEAGK